jgi:hypothetical protein
MNRLIYFLTFVLGTLVSAQLTAQTFQKTTDVFSPVYAGKVKWIDLDMDSDLDIMYCGLDGNTARTYIYENNNSVFNVVAHNLPDIRNGGFSLGDFDGDNDPDILITGFTGSANISALYENTGSFNFVLEQSFEGLINSIPSWFDLDNDGDLDFLFAGVDDSGVTGQAFVEKTLVYENLGGSFSAINSTSLPACAQCAVEWADANGDGFMDVIFSGIRSDGLAKSTLHLNNGDRTFRNDANIKLKQILNGDIKWGDFDNDGDPDVLQTGGEEGNAGGLIFTTLYENLNSNWKTRTDIILPTVGENWFGGTAWFDYNNDGSLDILLSGRGTSVVEDDYYFKIMKNNGNSTFMEVVSLPGVSDNSADFGDYDNDGDVDIVYLANEFNVGESVGIYENKLLSGAFSPNAKPAPPADNSLFEADFFRNQFTLNWDGGTDTETPLNGLRYNVYVRNVEGMIVAPAINLANGNSLTEISPNASSKKIIVKSNVEGTLYWAVQSVDGEKAGSLFSAEKEFFHVNGPQAIKAQIIDPLNVKLSWSDNSLVEDSYRIERSLSAQSGFSTLVTLPSNSSEHTDNASLATETIYYYRIFAVRGTDESGYDSLMVVIPEMPTNVVATPVNASTISLKWNDNSQHETNYVVERKKSGDANFSVVATLAANKMTYSNASLQEGTYYEYRIKATNQYGSSYYSSTVSAVTNFRPVVSDFNVNTLEDGLVLFTKDLFMDAFSDSDIADKLVSVRIESLPSFGQLIYNGTAVTGTKVIQASSLHLLKYIPNPDENGIETILYRASDGKDYSASQAELKLFVQPVNDPPVFFFSETIDLTEDFTDLTEFAPYTSWPENENSQNVVFSIDPPTSELVNMAIDPVTGMVTFTAIENAFGMETFTLTADDGSAENNIYSQEFTVLISPVNDLPVIQAIEDIEVIEDDDIPSITLVIEDPDDNLATLSVSATSDNQLLISDNNIVVDIDDPASTISITPVANKIGEAVITVTASDAEGSATETFVVSILPVTGISSVEIEDLEFYPNPAKSFLAVRGNHAGSLEISTSKGEPIIMSSINELQNTIDVSDLSPGVYLMRLFNRQGKVLVGKFVKD